MRSGQPEEGEGFSKQEVLFSCCLDLLLCFDAWKSNCQVNMKTNEEKDLIVKSGQPEEGEGSFNMRSCFLIVSFRCVCFGAWKLNSNGLPRKLMKRKI